MRRQIGRMRLLLITTVSLPLLLQTPGLSQTPQPARGRIEGVVIQAGATPLQPVVGARITVTKVNAATGANFLASGKMSGTLMNAGGFTPFPGTPAWALPPFPGGPVAPSIQEVAPPIPPVMTDQSGRFVVPDLDEGSYRLLVTHRGYVRQE